MSETRGASPIEQARQNYSGTLDETLSELAALGEKVDVAVEYGEELSEETKAAIAALVARSDAKVDGIGTYLLRLEEREDECLRESVALRLRAIRWEARRKRLAAYVRGVMEERGISKLEGARCTLTATKGSESVSVDSLADIPDEYVRAWVRFEGNRYDIESVKHHIEGHPGVEVTGGEVPDKRALKDAMKRSEVPGASINVGPGSLRYYISTNKVVE